MQCMAHTRRALTEKTQTSGERIIGPSYSSPSHTSFTPPNRDSHRPGRSALGVQRLADAHELVPEAPVGLAVVAAVDRGAVRVDLAAAVGVAEGLAHLLARLF